MTSYIYKSFIFLLCLSVITANKSDIQALIKLRETISQASTYIPTWFNSKIVPCNWSGITCSEFTVEAIDLSTLPFKIIIPTIFGEFKSLERLDLSKCQFFGQFPNSFLNLKFLQLLDLSQNQLSGSFPPSIGSFQNIQFLDLSNNLFSGSLPPGLGNLSSLQHLDLSHNGFSGSIFRGIGSLVRLLTIDLSSNSMTGVIPIELGYLVDLEILLLGANDFSGNIPSEIGKLKRLKELSIHSCKLSGKVPNEIINLTSLTLLDISENNLEGGLPADIGSLTNLKYLIVANAGLNGQIPSSVGMCKNLTMLDLSFNDFSGPLPNKLSQLPSLTTFIVEGNHLSGSIPSWISNWKSVIEIRLSKNHFSGNIPPLKLEQLTSFVADDNHLSGEVPSSLCDSKSISRIYLSENNLTGNIGHTFESCKNLTELVLMGNSLYGEIPVYLAELPLVTLELSHNNFSGYLPDKLFESNTLLEIFIANNQLEGVIPDSIGKIVGLQMLQLENNLFEGMIPSSIAKLGNLTNLSLHGNKLTGEIPSDIFKCENLVALDLGMNQLKGAIPKSISQLKLLDNLVLSHNQLSGEIPNEICSGFQMAGYPDSEFTQHYGVLDLSYNVLTGGIPFGLKNCTVLNELQLQGNRLNGSLSPALSELMNITFVDLSFNFLSGPVLPKDFSLKNLQGLLLSDNQLEGPIPEDLNLILPSLVKLNLSSNRIMGPFPESIFKSKSLTHIDISQNLLSGSIAFYQSSSLLLLNASNNYLSGPISEYVSNMTSLSVLDLHNNNLDGSLPLSLSTLDYLTYLDLSNNNLNDSVPCDICSIVGLSFVNLSGNKFDKSSLSKCKVGTNLCRDSHIVSYAFAKHSPSQTLSQASVWGIVVGCFAILLVLLISFLRWRALKQKSFDLRHLNKGKLATIEPASTDELLDKKQNKEALSINVATFEHKLLRVTLADVLKATENFSKSHIIGEGGFGTVYRAMLPENRLVAIKRLSGGTNCQGNREFLAEMETIGKVKHNNLVPLLGYCVYGDERFLIYQYMVNGSLGVWLRNRADAVGVLGWKTRFKIITGSARGLCFLHHGFVPHIIHRDMKSSNILLDENWEPRVSDFGLARIISACETHVSTELAGTFGYIPPEYGMSMKATAKGDVYSYGVVVLELLTGRGATGEELLDGGGNLAGWVKWMSEKGDEGYVVDPCLWGDGERKWREVMTRVLMVGKECTMDEPWMRPSMLEVVKRFKEIELMMEGEV